MASKTLLFNNSNIDISRRDDFYNLFYLLIFLSRGYLPWFQFMKQQEHCESRFDYLSSLNEMKKRCSVS